MTERMRALKLLTAEGEFKAGCSLYQRGLVSMQRQSDERLYYTVQTEPRIQVELDLSERSVGRCACGAFHSTQAPCRHIVASMLDANSTGVLERARHQRASSAGQALLQGLGQAAQQETELTLEISLLLAERVLHLGLRVGHGRLYVVKNIPEFLDAWRKKQTLPFGKGFVFEPRWMCFARVDVLLLELLEQSIALLSQAPQNQPKWQAIPPVYVDRLLRLLMARPFLFLQNDRTFQVDRVQKASIPMVFEADMAGRDLRLTAQVPEDLRPLSRSCAYLLQNGAFLHIPPVQQHVLQKLRPFLSHGVAEFRFSGGDRQRALSELLPTLRQAGELELGASLSERIVSRPLEAKVYLDLAGRTITAGTTFGYGDVTISPFSPTGEAAPEENALAQGLLLMRDTAAEQAVLDALAAAGFHVRGQTVYLSAQEAMYQFVTEGIGALQRVAQVYYSDAFKRMRPGQIRLRGSLRRTGEGLNFSLYMDDTPMEELLPILEALRDRRRYYFLKDGTMLDLTVLTEWSEVAEALVEGAAQEPEGVTPHTGLALHNYQAAYLTSLLAHQSLPIDVSQEVRRVAEAPALAEAPQDAPLRDILRPYQQRGLAWMMALHRLGMGGVLADDMGLGKTLQVIALMLWAKREQGQRLSVVVAPSSLTYNWRAEIARFAPELSVLVLEGGQSARKAQLRALKARPVDVLITSYPLLRRDVAQMGTLAFRFAILDEAQHIKNALSVGAVAAKQLKAETRLALTGTPMENHPGELWSIFDFVLPGYLHNFSQFMHRYGDGGNSEQLRRRIRPFLLRRMKKDVLPELPERIETLLMAEMTVEQKRVYQAAMLRLQQRVEGLLEQKGAGRSHIEVLAALTQLRQVCCHPILTLPDYSSSSGKMELLLEILPSALAAGHRVLLFSSFTSMLRILARTLETQGTQTLYLDGQTPPQDRLALVDRFNGGEGDVFLISLKAGGSGLNLTGADMVIHYDPWWNPAAEDQASDRAYRIGQTKNVQVLRLITQGTIEQQVMEMGKAKRALFDSLVTAGEQMPSQLSEAEIRALFDLRTQN